MVMKTLSLKQPFAELILQGRKKIELRKWRTNFRGEFLIHASKIPDEISMKKLGFRELPCGFIVGKAKLVDVKEYKNDEEFFADKDLHLVDNDLGERIRGNSIVHKYLCASSRVRFGFILEDIERFEKPISARGQLNFWEFDLN